MNKKSIITTAIIVIILLGAVFALKRAKEKDSSAPIAKVYPVVVKTKSVIKTETTLTLPYLALTQNDKDVKLASKIAGRIEFIKPSGSLVKKGNVIAKIDKASIESNIKSVKAQQAAINTAYTNLSSTHERTLKLIDVGGASIEQSQNEESKLAELASKKEALNQKINELNSMLSYAIITSPVNGRMSKTMVNVGDMAMQGHPIANIRAENGYYLLVRVPADLTIYGAIVAGTRYEAIPLHSSFMGLEEYKIYVENSGFISGNREEVDVEVFNGEAIQLPFDAVLNRNGKSYVLAVNGDKAFPFEVNILQTGEQGIVINDDGLIGKEIVLAKQDILLKLLSGTKLKIKNQ